MRNFHSPRARVLGLLALVVLVVAGFSGWRFLIRGSGIPSFSHVFVIMMENKDYAEVIGSNQAPYINQLARTYGLASKYYGVQHPSLPNYLALVSGSTQGINNDCPDCSVSAENLVDQLQAKGKSWRAYLEDMPSPCFNGTSAVDQTGYTLYVRRHNPFMYFKDVSQDSQRCNSVVPLSQLGADLQNNQIPDFAFIAPNMIHDMHDGTVADGDKWLSAFVPKLLESQAWKDNGVLFLIWDEGKELDSSGCCGGSRGGHAAAIVAAARGKTGFTSEVPYTHYSVLRTIEDAWGLGTLGEAGEHEIVPMTDFFR